MKEEQRKALQTMKCPRCEARLFTRDVLHEQGGIDPDSFELYCIYGHSFMLTKRDLYELGYGPHSFSQEVRK